MSMEITNNYSNYVDSYGSRSSKGGNVNSYEKDENGIRTDTVELKTSKPGVTKTEQIKTGYRNVNDYSKYLQEKYSYMNAGKTSISGIPTTVSVSGAYLKKCMNNPEEAKKLEENLAAIPDGVNYLKNYVKAHGLGSPVVTYVSYTVDDNGNVTMASGSTNDPDGKIARENAERKVKEKQKAEKKAAEKRAAKRAEEEKAEKKRVKEELAEKQAEKASNDDISISSTGNSIVSVTQSIASAMSDNPRVGTVVGFDVKA